jgi:4-amino-4-deoxy-L-arabinose transferase-like glycosyltransferase
MNGSTELLPPVTDRQHHWMVPGLRKWGFWLLLSLALGLRVAAAVAAEMHLDSEGRSFLIEGDANGYWELARHIAHGEEYSIYTPPRRVLRTPGFPLLLAACIRLFGDNIFAATLLMASIGTINCGLTWFLARRVSGDAVALIAMSIVAVSPLQIGISIQILSETWFSFWLLLCLLALERTVRSSTNKQLLVWSLLSGVLTGLTTLVRPGWILWTGLSALLVLMFADRTVSIRLRAVACLFLGCWLALLPWAARNHQVTGHWVYTSLWSGPSLYDGLHPGATGLSDMTFFDKENVLAHMSEFEMNEHYKQRAWEFARSHPVKTLELAGRKVSRYLSPVLNAVGFSYGLLTITCLVWYSSFVLVLIMGTISMRNAPFSLCLLITPFLQFLLVHMVFVGSIRYRLPVEFPLTIVAANGLASILRLVNPSSSETTPPMDIDAGH